MKLDLKAMGLHKKQQEQNLNFARIPKIGILTLFVLLFSTCSVHNVAFQEGKATKNVILLIGDGMGMSQISAALYSNRGKLNLEQCTHTGFMKTYSANDLITDSAAGATAFSCGLKTYNQAIGMTVDTLPCKTILEELQETGYATGLVATATIVHATPAAFAAHQPLRWKYEDIAADLSDSDVNLLVGGGQRYFDRRDQDGRNLLEEMTDRGYLVKSYLEEELQDALLARSEKLIYLSGDKHPLTRAAGRDYLPLAVQMGAQYLDRLGKKGFFLMAEGSQIDWGGHAGEGQLVIEEMLDFDEAVGKALDFARRNGETLVVVTSDHECGGMAVNPGSEMGEIKAAFNHNGHTATMVPVFAYGPSAELFDGIYDNTALYHKMRAALGLPAAAAATAAASPK
jgi:alkaline phosphatase